MKARRTPGGDAVTDLLLLTFRLNGAFLAAADGIAAPSGLTAAKWQVLGSVTRSHKSVSQIAREMGLTRQSVQRIANVLCGEKMIEFLDNPKHQRAKLVAATTVGVDAIRDLAQRQFRWSNDVAQEFEAEDLQATVRVLQRVSDRLRELNSS